MKTPATRFRNGLYMALALVLLGLTQVKANAAGEYGRQDSIVITKMLTSKKHHIKIYAGASQESVFFNASGEEGKVYQLFLFDVDGNMVKQSQVRNKQTTVLTNFNKGSYTFEVFSDDEHIENGTLVIK